MSIFNGKMTPLGRLIAKVTGRSPVGEADISPKTEVSADVESVKTMEGTISRAGKFFGGSILRIAMVFRFIEARSSQHTGRKAGASTAPATQINAESRVQAGKNATAKAHSAADAKVDSEITMSVLAGFVAYNRAAVVYICNILIGRVTKAMVAAGAIIKYRKELRLQRTTQMLAADPAIAESRYCRFTADSDAAGCAAPTEGIGAATEAPAGVAATMNHADVVAVNIQGVPRTAAAASLSFWFFPEQVGDALTIYGAYSAVQSGDALEIDLESASVYWANAAVADGVMTLVFAQTESQTGEELELI